MRPVGVAKERKKGQKLSCVKLAIYPDHPRRRSPLKFCTWGRVREVVIYFKFHESRSCGGGVENRPLPLTRPMAYTTACNTVQAVIAHVSKIRAAPIADAIFDKVLLPFNLFESTDISGLYETDKMIHPSLEILQM